MSHGFKVKVLTVSKALTLACALIILGIAAACLWPFNPHPKNDVSWLRDKPGIEFGDYGTVFAKRDFISSGNSAPCSFELWIEPGLTYDSATIFAFYSAHGLRQFKIRQAEDDLGVVRVHPDASGDDSRTAYFVVDHAFRKGSNLLISLVSDKKTTRVYFNGELVRQRLFDLSSADFAGQFVFGNSPVENNSWSGNVRGLAFYGLELTPEEVLEHYHAWISGNTKDLATNDNIALYTFKEGSGTLIHNQVGSGPDLFIPPHYQILHQEFLMPAWKEYTPSPAYWKDVWENIVGFTPLGFFICAYLRSRHAHRPAAWTILFGFLFSLLLEIAQSWLPVRDSSMTDVISNTTGTIVGVLLYSSIVFIRKWRIQFRNG